MCARIHNLNKPPVVICANTHYSINYIYTHPNPIYLHNLRSPGQSLTYTKRNLVFLCRGFTARFIRQEQCYETRYNDQSTRNEDGDRRINIHSKGDDRCLGDRLVFLACSND